MEELERNRPLLASCLFPYWVGTHRGRQEWQSREKKKEESEQQVCMGRQSPNGSSWNSIAKKEPLVFLSRLKLELKPHLSPRVDSRSMGWDLSHGFRWISWKSLVKARANPWRFNPEGVAPGTRMLSGTKAYDPRALPVDGVVSPKGVSPVYLYRSPASELSIAP